MKRVLPILLALVFVLTGCGSAAEADSKTAVADAAAEESVREGENGTIQLKVWGAEEDQALLAQLGESFKQQYAGQADIEFVFEVQGESDCKKALLGDVLNGADVFAFADDQLLSLAASGALLEVENADEVRAANAAEAVSAASVGDRLYAYPMTADNGYFMYYNKAYFTEEQVQTMDGMLQAAEAAGKKIAMDWTSGWYIYSFFGNTGMTFGLNEDCVTNYCNWNGTDGSIKGVDVAAGMLAIAQSPGFASMNNGEFIAGVMDGSVIACVSGVWDAATIKAAWGDDYAAVKLPTYTCAGQQIQMASFSGYKMVGVNAYSEHADWAMKFADWMTNEENQKLRFELRELGPSNINAADSDAVRQAPAIQALLAQSEFASLQRVGNNYWTPAQTFGETLAAGNPEGKDLQELMDVLVEGITASAVQ